MHILRLGKKPDVFGLLLISLAITLLFVGVFIAPIGVVAGLDPFTQTMNIYFIRFLSNSYFKLAGYLICYIVTQWCTLEATRIYILILVPFLSMFYLFVCQLDLLKKRPIIKIKTTLLLYEGLNCINQIGSNVIARIAGSLMSIAFFILVFINWILLKGWNLVPVPLYIMICFIAVIIYTVIFQSIPLEIKCNTASIDIIQRWIFQVSMFSPSSERNYLRRRVRAQQPVAIHYAQTKFEKDTQVNYYVSIVNYTINVLLLL